MRFVRFISIEELEVLLTTDVVKPIKPRRNCLYFFPAEGEMCDGWGEEYHTVDYRFQYVSGIVPDYYGDDGRRCIVLNLEMDESNLEQAIETYADPEGGFWDTIGVVEYHSNEGYTLGDVVSVDVFKESCRDLGLELEKHFETPQQCKEWLNAEGIWSRKH